SSLSQIDLTRTIKENTDIFHGTWIAHNGNSTYEMTLKRDMLKIPEGENMVPGYRETVWGKIKYFENGNLIRETPDNGFDAVVNFVSYQDPFHILFRFVEKVSSVQIYFDFVIDEHNSKKAVWKFEPENTRKRRGGRFNAEPDIPDGMTWTKVE
ncbi:MAG: hypothetical protein LUE10_03555, partial [Alistipes sp.]|nr:hypothetical protein [Alistipes sp.]